VHFVGWMFELHGMNNIEAVLKVCVCVRNHFLRRSLNIDAQLT
jgi:hypothetical protein